MLKNSILTENPRLGFIRFVVFFNFDHKHDTFWVFFFFSKIKQTFYFLSTPKNKLRKSLRHKQGSQLVVGALNSVIINSALAWWNRDFVSKFSALESPFQSTLLDFVKFYYGFISKILFIQYFGIRSPVLYFEESTKLVFFF